MIRSVLLSCMGMLIFMSALPARAADTATCEGKRSWQRNIVEAAIREWLEEEANPEYLLELMQAEQGIAACGDGESIRLHTTRLPINLVPSQLGAVLLANELEWRGLVPAPEAELAGKYFRVAAPPAEPARPERRTQRNVPERRNAPSAAPRNDAPERSNEPRPATRTREPAPPAREIERTPPLRTMPTMPSMPQRPARPAPVQGP